MSDTENKTADAPVDDIEAAADAAATAAAENPEPERADAPPKPRSATGKKVKPQKPRTKKTKPVKASSKKGAPKSGPEQAKVVAKARKDARVKPETPEVDENAEAEAAEKAAESKKATDEAVAALIEGLLSPLDEDESQEDRDALVAEMLDDVRKTSAREDVLEAAAECLAKADEAQRAVVKLRELHGNLLVLAPNDDGRSHNERLKEVQKRSAEIRAQRARDRLTLLAKGAGKSRLDQHLAGQPRKSPADADQKTE